MVQASTPRSQASSAGACALPGMPKSITSPTSLPPWCPATPALHKPVVRCADEIRAASYLRRRTFRRVLRRPHSGGRTPGGVTQGEVFAVLWGSRRGPEGRAGQNEAPDHGGTIGGFVSAAAWKDRVFRT
ncbi:hypothetical protein GCM10010286_61610 [Streptomyces toxytricini]|nr:hypothetical protein GCM10010286_61610 [Streptomyces toxytricini]